MQSSKEQKGELRKSSSVINEIKENNRMGKTRDFLKKLEIQREHFKQRWAQ